MIHFAIAICCFAPLVVHADSKQDAKAAHKWLRVMLEEANSKKAPFAQKRTDLPLYTIPVVSLNLYGASVTDDGLKHLAAFPKIKSLTLSGKRITDAGLKHLLTLKELESLKSARHRSHRQGNETSSANCGI